MRLYTIGHDQEYLDVGKAKDGRKILMGLYCPDLVAIFFDASGDLLGHEERRLEFLQPESVTVIVDGQAVGGREGGYNIYDERISSRIEAWREELGFHPEPIRVKRFFLDDLGIGIGDYPDHFGEILGDPGASEEEKDDVRDSMRLWDDDGQFVLHWGNDYWLDDGGEFVSS